MYKTMTAISLKEGANADELFKYHVTAHAQDALKCANGKMRKYVVNRVKSVVGHDIKYFAIVEMWWDKKEDADAYVEAGKSYVCASGMAPGPDYESRGGGFEFKVEVEEMEIPTT